MNKRDQDTVREKGKLAEAAQCSDNVLPGLLCGWFFGIYYLPKHCFAANTVEKWFEESVQGVDLASTFSCS